MIPTTLGEKIAYYRKEKKWSQEDLEEYSGVSRNQIGRIERDECRPKPETLEWIEEALGLPQGKLLRNVQLSTAIDDPVLEIESALEISKLNQKQMKNVQIIVELICEIVNEGKKFMR